MANNVTLYFYFLEKSYMTGKVEIKRKEAEALERERSYKLCTAISGYYNVTVTKDKIDRLTYDYNSVFMILLEDDVEKVKKKFTMYMKDRIEHHEREIEEFKETLKVIEDYK